MASSKISALTDGTTPADTDEFPIARAGANRKLTWLQMRSAAGAVHTWAELLALSGVPDGAVYRVALPVIAGGAYGTSWVWGGGVWRPAGMQALWHLTAQADGVSGGSSSEQILAAALVSPGVLSGARAVVMQSRWITSGSDGAARYMRMRVGTAGSTSDAAVHVWATASASARVIVFSTHLSADGASALLASSYPTSSGNAMDVMQAVTAAPASATAVPDMTANALYVSLSVQQSSASSTISLQRAWLEVW